MDFGHPFDVVRLGMIFGPGADADNRLVTIESRFASRAGSGRQAILAGAEAHQ
jgi:nucleoside-diphosphate-sugar epimerase